MLAEWEWVLVGERRLHKNMLRAPFYTSVSKPEARARVSFVARRGKVC